MEKRSLAQKQTNIQKTPLLSSVMGVVREDFNEHDLREVAYLLFIIMNYSDYCQFPTKLYETLCRPMLYYLNVIDYIQISALSSHEKNV